MKNSKFSGFSTLLEKLVKANGEVSYFEEKAAKLEEARTNAARLRQELTQALDKQGFPEETVDLLLESR